MEEMIIICFIPVLSLVSKTQDQHVGYRNSYRKKLFLVQQSSLFCCIIRFVVPHLLRLEIKYVKMEFNVYPIRFNIQ